MISTRRSVQDSVASSEVDDTRSPAGGPGSNAGRSGRDVAMVLQALEGAGQATLAREVDGNE